MEALIEFLIELFAELLGPILLIFILPVFAIFGLIAKLVNHICSRFECKKYEKSAYCKIYNEKYHWGITRSFSYSLMNKLCKTGVVLKKCDRPKLSGDVYLKSNKHCFVILVGQYSIMDSADGLKDLIIQKAGQNKASDSLNQLIDKQFDLCKDECINRKLLLFLKTKNITDEQRRALSNAGILLYSNIDELAGQISNIVANEPQNLTF